MKDNEIKEYPSFYQRICSVWYRHMRVYTKNIITNGFPPFLEPLIFLVAIGLGFGKYISHMKGVPYIEFLATGLLVSTAMFTSAFECSFGTYIRLEFDKAYNGMLASPISVYDLLIGEIIWAGTKGFFFSAAVLIIVSLFGVLPVTRCLLAPIVGFLTGIMFAVLSLLVTSYVKNINQFNFYFTGFISPMFFFSGVVFSLDNLPRGLRFISEILPLTHAVRLVRMICIRNMYGSLLTEISYISLFTVVIGFLAIKRLKKRLID